MIKNLPSTRTSCLIRKTRSGFALRQQLVLLFALLSVSAFGQAVLVDDINKTGPPMSGIFSQLTYANSYTFFINGSRLFRTDGSREGTISVADHLNLSS